MARIDRTVILKDCTMREGLDVPGVSLDLSQKKGLLEKLRQLQVPEVELVAPGHFDRDLDSLAQMIRTESALMTSGLIYANLPGWQNQIARAKGLLDRVDLLMPLSDLRPPVGAREKSRQMKTALRVAAGEMDQVGVGFPHATQAERIFLLEMCREAARNGAARITLYDTNGSSDPWFVEELIQDVRAITDVQICFHAHNDLGMATANAVAAVKAGAECLDVTVNGLGDRAGNASLEQVAVALFARGVATGVKLDLLCSISQAVAAWSGVPIGKLAPVVGELVFCHKSPSHLASPALFEAFDPTVIGSSRSLCEE